MKCSANCGGNGSCNKTDGRCLSGCADRGTTTASCDTASLQGQDTLNGKNIAAIVGGVVAGVAVVVAVVVAIVVLMLRRRRRSRTKTEATLRRTGERRYMETPLQFEVFITTGEQQQSAASKPKAEVRPLPLHDDTDVYENCDLYANSQGTEAAARPANHRPTNDQSPDTALYANAAEIGEASGDQRPPKPHQEPQQAQPQLKPKPAGAENQPKSRQNESLAEAALFVAKPAALTAKRDDVVEEVDAYPESGDEVSPEDSDVYAVFKAKQPKLDAVQKYLVDRLASGKLCEEFSKIPKLDETEPVEAGNLTVNIKKNRFISVLPYDRNRVVLRDSYKEAKSTDYVNASYVMGNESNKRYIAAQGPVNNTVGDFWRLVWQERATHIVMLTNLTEVGKPKCFLYWPESEGTTTTFGPVMVKTNNIECRATFFIRHFTIKKLGVNSRNRINTALHVGLVGLD